MEAVFLKLLNMSITAGWLILAVAALRLLFRNMPKWGNFVLWALVGIRLALPFSVESYLSLVPSAETVPQDILYSEAPTIHTGLGILNRAVNPVISASLAPAVGASINPVQIITYIASIIWLAGIVTLLTYMTVSFLRLRRKLRTSVLLRGNIWQSENVASPFVLGVFRPRIYLPFEIADGDIAYVVAHETAHIRRRDHWIKPVGFLLLTIYWFNPLIWMAYILICRDIELACDEHVIRELGADERKFYSSALLSCSVGRRSAAACPLAFGEVGVKQRVKNILDYKKPAFWIIIVALAACIIVAVCFLTNPKSNADLAMVMDEYDAGGLGGTFINSGNPAYKIGMNAYGMPVFADTGAAFAAIQEDCAGGFAYLSEIYDLPAVTKENYEQYKTYGWQSEAGDEALRKQCEEISYFFDIYENSFFINYAVTTPPTADEGKIYTGGALLGQLGALSYLPKDGSYYAQIILSHNSNSLTVINNQGQTIFEGSTPKVSQMTRTALLDKLGEILLFGMNEADVPEYDSSDDMAVYSYYRKDDPENAAYSIYWFHGEPKWFAEGEMLRIYALEPLEQADIYTSRRCVYMNPLSSYYPFNGDSGYRYLIGKDSLSIVSKETGETQQSFEDIDWNWQTLGEDEWRGMFSVNIMAPDISIYDKPLVLKLSSQYCLFNMDGTLWLGQYHGGKTGMWSIYELMPDGSGSVVWDYAPTVSFRYPAFPFHFDLQYTRIEAACSAGYLIGFDDYAGTAYPQGKTLTVPKGSALYWSPQNGNEYSASYALSAEITFTVYNGNDVSYSGVLSVVRTDNIGEVAAIPITYNAVLLDCEGLYMRQSESAEGAIIAAVPSCS